MAADLAAAQSDLSSSLIQLRSTPNIDPSLVGQAEQQLAAILSLKGQLATSGPQQIAAMTAQIAAVVQSATALARQAEQAAATSNGGPASLASASQAARAAVNDFENDYYKERKFEPYLRFASPEDERTYREREKKREEEIEAAKALGTPEGNKRATDLAIEQMRDAGAHGATESPDYAPTYKKVTDASDALAAQLSKSKATSAVTKPSIDPLDDVQPESAGAVPASLLAKIKAAGVVVADQDGTGHGVSAGAGTQQSRGAGLSS